MFDDSTHIVREGVERACRDFTQRLAPFGFARTKKMFWTRTLPHTVEFIHLHRRGSSYGRPINYSVDLRVHLGIRVLNDPFAASALNGPSSDDLSRMRAFRYHLRFNASTGSTYERCLDDLVRFIVEQGEPWFNRFRTVEALLESSDSPLRHTEQQHLRVALNGQADPMVVAKSLALLGLQQ